MKIISGMSGTLLFLIVAVLIGCSTVDKTTQKIARDLRPRTGGLKLRMAVLPISHATSLKPEELENGFVKPLSLALRRKCSDIIFEMGTDLDGIGKKDAIKGTGFKNINSFTISKSGRRRGFNAITTIHLEGLITGTEKRGMLWFKEDRHLIQAHGDATIFNTLTATKALSRDFYFEAEVDELVFEKIRSGKQAEVVQIQKALLQIAEEMAGAICEAADGIAWRAYIASVDEEKVTLSSGKREGLKVGNELAVFDQGTIVQGAGGQQFIIPGKAVGRIQIANVNADTAEARVVSGGPFDESHTAGFD